MRSERRIQALSNWSLHTTSHTPSCKANMCNIHILVGPDPGIPGKYLAIRPTIYLHRRTHLVESLLCSGWSHGYSKGAYKAMHVDWWSKRDLECWDRCMLKLGCEDWRGRLVGDLWAGIYRAGNILECEKRLKSFSINVRKMNNEKAK